MDAPLIDGPASIGSALQLAADLFTPQYGFQPGSEATIFAFSSSLSSLPTPIITSNTTSNDSGLLRFPSDVSCSQVFGFAASSMGLISLEPYVTKPVDTHLFTLNPAFLATVNPAQFIEAGCTTTELNGTCSVDGAGNFLPQGSAGFCLCANSAVTNFTSILNAKWLNIMCIECGDVGF